MELFFLGIGFIFVQQYYVEQEYIPVGCIPPTVVAIWGALQEALPPPGTRHTPLWTEWQTGVKILPCPKVRLRAVNILAMIWFLLAILQRLHIKTDQTDGFQMRVRPTRVTMEEPAQ